MEILKFFLYFTEKVELGNKDVQTAHVCSLGSTACMKSQLSH